MYRIITIEGSKWGGIKMSDEIKNESIDEPNLVKELSGDELGQVNGGTDSYGDFWKAMAAEAAMAVAAATPKTKTGKS
jgi:hypothetical protein